jgi:uncharacterized membrane protein YfcA
MFSEMFEFSTAEIITALISAFFIGFSKITGTSLGAAIIPMFSSIFPPKVATGILCIAFLLASIQAFKVHLKNIKLAHFKILLPGTFLGFIIGGAALLFFDEKILRIFISFTIIFMLIFNSGKSFYAHFFEKIQSSFWFGPLFGLLIGTTSMIANAASPLMVVYLLAKKEPKHFFIGTQVAFFLFIDLLKIPFYLYTGIITSSSFTINLIMIPVMIIGGTIGFFFIKWIPDNKFRILVTITAILSAAKLAWSAI